MSCPASHVIWPVAAKIPVHQANSIFAFLPLIIGYPLHQKTWVHDASVLEDS